MALYALRDFARHPPPLVGTAGTLVQNAHSIAVFDAFPKAKYHFLVLPRLPFAAPGYEDVGDRDLASLSALLRHKARGAVLAEMERTAEDVLEMVRDEMVKTEGFQWGINVGFHAVPSMQ
jgi:aprataxin